MTKPRRWKYKYHTANHDHYWFPCRNSERMANVYSGYPSEWTVTDGPNVLASGSEPTMLLAKKAARKALEAMEQKP